MEAGSGTARRGGVRDGAPVRATSAISSIVISEPGAPSAGAGLPSIPSWDACTETAGAGAASAGVVGLGRAASDHRRTRRASPAPELDSAPVGSSVLTRSGGLIGSDHDGLVGAPEAEPAAGEAALGRRGARRLRTPASRQPALGGGGGASGHVCAARELRR